MTWQIPLQGGKQAKAEGKKGVVFELSPEAEAFTRWQKRDFLDLERLLAKSWRKKLASLDLGKMAKALEALGISGKSCKKLENAKIIA